ncbi:hypothetical protein [Kitasatospora purpeofusca]
MDPELAAVLEAHAAQIANRITFRCTLIQTGTESYRYQATQESLFPAPN